MAENFTKRNQDIKEVLGNYMKAWKLKKYSAMQKNCTHTYRKSYKTTEQLSARFPFAIKSYRVSRLNHVTPVVTDAVVKVVYQGKEMDLYMRLVQEVTAYAPNQAGDWGINPISIRQVVKDLVQ